MTATYSQLLRPIGEALAPLQVDSFALKIDNIGVSISAQRREFTQPPRVAATVHSVWEIFRRKNVEAPAAPRSSLKVFEFRYSYDDISRMDAEGRCRRVTTGEKPDPHTLSQLLRAAGGVVDQKQGRLLGVTMADQDIAIEYESVFKQKATEKYTVASLYDYWVKMYLRRRERS